MQVVVCFPVPGLVVVVVVVVRVSGAPVLWDDGTGLFEKSTK